MTTQRERAIEIIRKQIGHMIPRDDHYQPGAIAATVYDALLAAGIIREWRDIKDAPETLEQILVGFKGQFEWLNFVALSRGAKTTASGYSPPTHYQLLTAPPTESTEP